MSLRLRLIASIALVLLVTLAIGSVLIYWHAVAKLETEMRAAIAVGSRIAENAVDEQEEVVNPLNRLALLVADFNGDRHLVASLIDPNGKTVMVSRLEPPETEVPSWLMWLLSRPSDKVNVKLPAVFDGYGSIVFENSMANEISEVWADARLYIGLLGAFSALVLVLTYLTVGRVLAPIGSLQSAFKRMGGGDYEARVAEAGPPEFVELCRGFNDMGERLLGMDDKTRKLRRQLDTAHEEERAHLARDLHDDVSPLLFSVDVDATMIRQYAERGATGEIAGRSDAIRDAVAQVKRQVKAILGRLRPAILIDLGLAPALENLLAAWRARHADVVFTVDLSRTTFGQRLDGTLHHIIRESVSNALRHGKPKRIDIVVEADEDGAVNLEVADDGGGIKTEFVEKGFGITGMFERAAILGGAIGVQRRKDIAGVIVQARFPPSNETQQSIAELEGASAA